MATWWVVLIIVYPNNYSATSMQVEFHDMKACQVAQQSIRDRASRGIYAECFERATK